MKKILSRALHKIPGWLRWVLAIGSAAFLLLVVWGVVVEPRLFSEVRETAEIPNLSAAWEGQQVALIADLQVGMWLGNTDTIARIVARLVEMRPAAVLIAGDFIYHPLEGDIDEPLAELEPTEFRDETLEEVRKVVELLRPLSIAGIPTYAVLGNHDFGIKQPGMPPVRWLAGRVSNALREIDVQVLTNAALAMKPPAATARPAQGADALFLVGLGSHLAGEDRAAEAFAAVPEGAARLVLMHNPLSFGSLPAARAPVAFAGHSHGGQIRIPFTPNWSWVSLLKETRVFADGWIPNHGEAGNRLYVSRGIGFSRVPIRINCRPELTVFTLRRSF